jgi:hypothetical protein
MARLSARTDVAGLAGEGPHHRTVAMTALPCVGVFDDPMDLSRKAVRGPG